MDETVDATKESMRLRVVAAFVMLTEIHSTHKQWHPPFRNYQEPNPPPPSPPGLGIHGVDIHSSITKVKTQ